MNTRAKQVAIVAAGVMVAAVMVVLGLWQAQVFVDKGNHSAQDRAAQPPVPLLDFVNADGTVGDVYGKPVTVSGEWLPSRQVLVGSAGTPERVLTGLRVADGRVLPVVRGVQDTGVAAPAAPTGAGEVTGIFLPGEGDPETPPPADQLGSVRMPLLAQRWSEQLLPGFVTVDAAASDRWGLRPAEVALPSGEGSFQNGGYALQWWVFAAFGLGIALKVAQSLGQRDRKAREEAARRVLAEREPQPDAETQRDAPSQ